MNPPADNSQQSGEQWEQLRPLAREMRHEPTLAEEALWKKLRRNQINGLHFRRQHAIKYFIVDFYCAALKLVIEVDGPIHDEQREQDAKRQAILESLGLCVVRFKNEDVLQQMDGVLEVIYEIASKAPPYNPAYAQHTPPLRGEGLDPRRLPLLSPDAGERRLGG